MLMYLSWVDLSVVFLTVFAAYVIFGIAGFGTSLVATPVLAMFVPLGKIVPLLALMDMCAATGNFLKDGRKAELHELKRLIPFMISGSMIGAAVLLYARPDTLVLALGLFVVAYAVYALAGIHPHRKFLPGAAIPFGLVGGVFSALFGTGGLFYAIYLSGRIDKTDRLRITQSTLIGLATMTRAILFLLAGVYMDTSLLLLALMLAPAMILGMLTGRHVSIRLSREQFMRVIHYVVLMSGLMLLGRYFSG